MRSTIRILDLSSIDLAALDNPELYAQARSYPDAEAQAMLGLRYLKANAPINAVDFLELAAKGGSARGTYNLGLCQINGWGTPQDIKNGLLNILKSAQMDYAPADYMFAQLLSAGVMVSGTNLLQKDPELAFIFYARAACHAPNGWPQKQAAMHEVYTHLDMARHIEGSPKTGMTITFKNGLQITLHTEDTNLPARFALPDRPYWQAGNVCYLRPQGTEP